MYGASGFLVTLCAVLWLCGLRSLPCVGQVHWVEPDPFNVQPDDLAPSSSKEALAGLSRAKRVPTKESNSIFIYDRLICLCFKTRSLCFWSYHT